MSRCKACNTPIHTGTAFTKAIPLDPDVEGELVEEEDLCTECWNISRLSYGSIKSPEDLEEAIRNEFYANEEELFLDIGVSDGRSAPKGGAE